MADPKSMRKPARPRSRSRSRPRSASSSKYSVLSGGASAVTITELPTARIEKSSLVVTLLPGTHVHVRNGAMMWMDDGIDVSVGAKGWLSSLFSQNDLLYTEFANKTAASKEVVMGGSVPCEILAVEIRPGESYIAHAGSFLACTGNVERGGKVSFKGLVLGTGVVMGKYSVPSDAARSGLLWLMAFGGIHSMDVKPGHSVQIDNGLFLCAPESVVQTWTFGKVGSLIGSALNGEGLVFKVHGGEVGRRVYMHSQNLGDMAKALAPYLGDYFQPRK